MSDKAKVENCPFCGSNATMRTTSASDSYVECLDVGCCKQSGLYQQPKYAAKDWNTRTPPVAELVEVLEDLVEKYHIFWEKRDATGSIAAASSELLKMNNVWCDAKAALKLAKGVG